MQREIEALLEAYLRDKDREARLVTELLTTISSGASARQLMIERLAVAIERAMPKMATELRPISDDIDLAIRKLREASATSTTH